MSPGNAAAPEPEFEGEAHIKGWQATPRVSERDVSRDSGRDVPRRVPVDHDDLVVPYALKRPARRPVPVAHALYRRVWQGRRLVAVACAYCDGTHWHRFNDVTRAVGYRTPPCQDDTGRQYLVVGERTAPLR